MMTHAKPATTTGRALLTLCLLAGFASLAGLSAVAAALLFGIGPGGLASALLCGALALGAGGWAAVLACGAPPNPGSATAPGS